MGYAAAMRYRTYNATRKRISKASFDLAIFFFMASFVVAFIWLFIYVSSADGANKAADVVFLPAVLCSGGFTVCFSVSIFATPRGQQWGEDW